MHQDEMKPTETAMKGWGGIYCGTHERALVPESHTLMLISCLSQSREMHYVVCVLRYDI